MDSVQGIMKPNSSEIKEPKPWWETGRTPDLPLHADGVSYQAYYSEVGKAYHTGKDLTDVRSPQRKLVPDKVELGQYEQTSLRGIAIKAEANEKHRFQNLYRCLNAPFLYTCWNGLNKKASSGVDKVTAETYEKNLEANIQALAERLKTNRYRAKLVRRCYIPKENGKERPLTGANTYTGVTTTNNGTLSVNGSLTSDVTVNANGAYSGGSTVTGSILLNGGIAPGNSIGIITINGNYT